MFHVTFYMSPQTIIFFGRSGSGKGTQARLLEEYLRKNDSSKRGVIYIETGARFRQFMNEKGYTNKLTKDVLDQGGLLPEFLPIWLWSGIFIKEYTGKEHLILDGLSRRVAEAPVLSAALKFYKREKPCVIVLNVSRKWSMDRLKERGRYDDAEKEINRRLDWYDANVAPTIEYFKKDAYYKYLEIDGEQPVEKVHEDIIGNLQL